RFGPIDDGGYAGKRRLDGDVGRYRACGATRCGEGLNRHGWKGEAQAIFGRGTRVPNSPGRSAPTVRRSQPREGSPTTSARTRSIAAAIASLNDEIAIETGQLKASPRPNSTPPTATKNPRRGRPRII